MDKGKKEGKSKVIKRLMKIFISLIGFILGILLYFILKDFVTGYIGNEPLKQVAVALLFAIIISSISFIISESLLKFGNKVLNAILNHVSNQPLNELLFGVFGTVIGLVIAFLINSAIKDIPYVGIPISIIIYIVLGYVGFSIGNVKKGDAPKSLSNLFPSKDKLSKDIINTNYQNSAYPKILDTSAIIDGRIHDVIETGFIEGSIIVPNFVLGELQHIADSADDLKRVRGRRGLDALNKIQKSKMVKVENVDIDYDDTDEVDVKLLRLAKDIGGCVITNDYNLNKVAQFQRVKVLNINELANSIKTKLIAGEELVVTIVKEGKERSQGIGYLDDGTMIVVEDSKNLIGETIETVVTSVLQTNAGRMIFAKIVE